MSAMAEFRIQYSRRALEELRELRKSDQVTITQTIERSLRDHPERVTARSIKKLNPPLLAGYRLRIGDYRAFYDVYRDDKTVVIIAIRYKGRLTLEEAAHD